MAEVTDASDLPWLRRIVIAAGILAVLGAAAWGGLRWLQEIVRREIEVRGSALTQTEVTVQAVRLSPLRGTATLEGLAVGNPPGFAAPHAFELDAITVDLALASVLADPLVIEAIDIAAPRVVCELDAEGRTNIELLRDAVERSEKRAEPRPTPGAAEPSRQPGAQRPPRAERRLIIDHLALHEGELYVDARAVGGPERRETLPGFDLSGIGAAEGGATPAQVGKIVVTALARDVAVAVAATQLEQWVGKHLGGPAGDLIKKGGAEAIRRGLGGVLDELLRR